MNKVITEDYCDFETAIHLKKKGFDIVTEKCYILDNAGLCAVSIGQIFNGSPQGKHEIAAPTLQMAMKWLRKVHGLFINLFIYEYGEGKVAFEIEKIPSAETVIEDYEYATYEEAAEAAIKYCLTNLID